MRMETAFESFHGQASENTGMLEYVSRITENANRHYFTHFADGQEIISRKGPDIVPVGLEIRERRNLQRVKKLHDMNLDKFYIVAPEGVRTDEEKEDFKTRLMDLWMLDGDELNEEVVSREDVVILDRKEAGYRTSDIYHMLEEENKGEVDPVNTGIRCLTGELEYDKPAADKGILQVNVAEDVSSNLNQYEVFVNLLLSREKNDMRYSVSGLQKLNAEDAKHGLYLYGLPRAKKLDLETEIRKYYDRFLEEILVRA
jgi:hypothetical protein